MESARHAPPPVDVPRIVVADADADVRAFYRRSFIDCDVLEAGDGREALAKALVRPPWLVVTELRLPLIDGYDLCQILRQDRTTARVPIVVATTEDRDEEIARVQPIADVVLRKPMSADVLVIECARLMARAHHLHGQMADLIRGTTESLRASATVLRMAAELGETESRRKGRPRMLSRFTTTTPPAPPPELACISCTKPLMYELSYVGGVNANHPEQWDYFSCPTCGDFQFRHRTRKLRSLRDDEKQWLDGMRKPRP